MAKYTSANPRNDVPIDQLREVFSYDSKKGVLKKNGRRVGWVHPLGYRYVQIGRRSYKEHRVAWAIHYGEWPDGQIDHINRNKADNRIENLRCVSPSENQANMPVRKDNKTGFVGVVERPGRFVATARINGKRYNIGSFRTAEDANDARNAFLSERRK